MSFNVFSIGPGNLSKEEFLKRLRERGIAVLVDLRAHPYSTYAPQFDRENLERDLSRLNVKYLYFGNKLGGRPPEGFETFRRTKKFEENVGELVSKLKEIDKTAAIMCAELDQEKCHRRYIVGEIRNRGIDVTVIDKYNKSANKNTLVAYS